MTAGRPILYQQSVTTDQAYNAYPAGVGGKSLYEFNSTGPSTIASTPRAVKVSFDRPYSFSGAGDSFWYEIHFIRWLEQVGWDVAYSTNIDTHAEGQRLLRHRAFLSVGHDEYWSREMYDAAERARDAGVNLAFFGANAVYWQIRLEPSTRGVPNRVVVCYKREDLDTGMGRRTTVRWRDPPVNRPEQTLVGIQFTDWPVDADYVVMNSSHWVYRGTNLADGDRIRRLVGYESDRLDPAYPPPPHRRYVALSRSPVGGVGSGAYSESSIYQALSGAWVFAAGTIWWSLGLEGDGRENDGDSRVDVRVQRITHNLLRRFVGPESARPGAPT